MQITGHMVDEQGNQVAGPTISGSFSGVLTVHFEDGSQRQLWEKHYPAKGPGRCLPVASPDLEITHLDHPLPLMLLIKFNRQLDLRPESPPQ